MKTCYKCKKNFPSKEVYVRHKYTSQNGKQWFSYICRMCNTLIAKKYRSTKKGAKQASEANVRSHKKHKQKHNARNLLYAKVKKGEIIRPCKCQNCGRMIKPEAHHTDYSKPYDVVWACKKCHWIFHRMKQ